MSRSRLLAASVAVFQMLAILVVGLLVTGAAAPGMKPAEATPEARAAFAPAPVNGTGSTYVALAMQQWTAEGQAQGLRVNYTPSSSPDGLSRFSNGNVDFAGTEAEFSSLNQAGDVRRGYQYVPDVAGAIAVMYNVRDTAGRKVDYLHLSARTVARIFTGDITHWDDPAITADHVSPALPNGLKLPREPINVVYRGGQSGTTALFYDYIAETDRALFNEWANRNRLPTNTRIIQLDGGGGSFAPKTQAMSGSDQIAQHLASDAGLWSIAYDEFGYAIEYGATSAWIQNASGRFVLPYAENISAALESASLRADLSQELSGVYASRNEKAYPISAYSYLVVQCAASPDRPTCRGSYTNPGITETMAAWMNYIACDGQVAMARIGYSPLPPNLSQEIMNSISRMNGEAPRQLNPGNCSNPRFHGSLGAGSESPVDPLFAPGVTPVGGGGGGEAGAGGGSARGSAPGASGTGSVPGAASATRSGSGSGADGEASAGTDGSAGAGRLGSAAASSGGGSGSWRAAAPLAYSRAIVPGDDRWPLVVLLLIVALPPAVISLRRRMNRGSVAG